MAIDAVFKKIDRYLKKENIGPLVVDIQNKADLDSLMTYYNLPQNSIIYASDPKFCKRDEFPAIANILDILSKEKKNFFVREIASFYRLKGENALVQVLMELLSMNIAGHAVIITYQCGAFLEQIIRNDKRLEGRVCITDGVKADLPQFVFTMKDINLDAHSSVVQGVHRIASAVESGLSGVVYVETEKTKKSYPYSLYVIGEMKRPYEVLCSMDSSTTLLPEALGTEEDWQYVLSEFQTHPSWEQLVSAKIGNVHSLDIAISNYLHNSNDKKWIWLYLIGVKLFGAGADWCLNTASMNASSPKEFLSNLYRCILEIDVQSPEFTGIYERRKALLNAVGNPVDEVVDFCKIVLSKERDALYYLTDNTIQEKELVFKLLNKYGLDFDKATLLSVLERVYPDLYDYLLPYRFKNALLDGYFQDYKYQKVINKILPEFMAVVAQQAVNRDYNVILQPRSSVIESIDCTQAQTYFTDAMGVEYLGFIMSRCRELGLMAKVTVCRSELPSITSRNKEFWDVFSTDQRPIITFDKIDKIKHHGEEGYDYSRADRKLPIHLIRELELIDELLRKVKVNLANGNYDKAILVSDHGASRLAVIHETENLVEMASHGQHSGRCCPKSDVDVKPDNATDADDFWALANYDRFKGSRKANVEVHGGASLEEVVVPIIEISYLRSAVEVKLMPVDASATFTGVPEILVSFRKKAAIKIFATQKLVDVSIEIDGHFYDAKAVDDYFYVVDAMPEIRRAKTYMVNVYACGNRIASDLPLRVKKESGSEKSIL